MIDNRMKYVPSHLLDIQHLMLSCRVERQIEKGREEARDVLRSQPGGYQTMTEPESAMESEPDMETTPRKRNRPKKMTTAHTEQDHDAESPSQHKRDEIMRRLGIRDRRAASEITSGHPRKKGLGERSIRRRYSMGAIVLDKSQGEESTAHQYSTVSDGTTSNEEEI